LKAVSAEKPPPVENACSSRVVSRRHLVNGAENRPKRWMIVRCSIAYFTYARPLAVFDLDRLVPDSAGSSDFRTVRKTRHPLPAQGHGRRRIALARQKYIGHRSVAHMWPVALIAQDLYAEMGPTSIITQRALA